MQLSEQKDIKIFLTHDDPNVREFAKIMLEHGYAEFSVYKLRFGFGITFEYNTRTHHIFFKDNLISIIDLNAPELSWRDRYSGKEPEQIKTYSSVDDLIAYLNGKKPKKIGYPKLTIISAGKNKISVMRLLREITRLSLKQCKEIVDNLPKELNCDDFDLGEGLKITKKRLEEEGAICELK